MKKGRNDAVTSQQYGETQYGNHRGYDAQEYQKMVAPKMTLGKAKGDRNRGTKGSQGGPDYYDQL